MKIKYKVIAIDNYYDIKEQRNIVKGDVIEVVGSRKEELISKGLVKEYIEPTREKNIAKSYKYKVGNE